MSIPLTLHDIAVDILTELDKVSPVAYEFPFIGLSQIKASLLRVVEHGQDTVPGVGHIRLRQGKLRVEGTLSKSYTLSTRFAAAGFQPSLRLLHGLRTKHGKRLFARPDTTHPFMLLTDHPALTVGQFVDALEGLIEHPVFTDIPGYVFTVQLTDQVFIRVTHNGQSRCYGLTEVMYDQILRLQLHNAVLLHLHRYPDPRRSPESPKGKHEDSPEAGKGMKFHQLIEQLKTTTHPTDAFDLIVDFLGGGCEFSGTLAYQGMETKYRLLYTPDTAVLEIELTITALTQSPDALRYPLFHLSSHTDRSNIRVVYGSIQSLIKLFD